MMHRDIAGAAAQYTRWVSYVAFSLLLAAFGTSCGVDADVWSETPAPAGTPKQDVSTDWWATVQQGVEAENYRITERDGLLGADNPARGFAATFDEEWLALGPLPPPRDREPA